MRVTDEMVERAINDWLERSSQALGSRTLKTGETVRGMLEAALADVPEPMGLKERWAAEGAVNRADAMRDRADAAEAKLAKVRAWADKWTGVFSPTELLAILDEP